MYRACLLWLALRAVSAAESLTLTLLPVPFPLHDRPACPSLSEDGRLLAYQSRQLAGAGGADIWLSRYENGRWSAPYNAGPGINTAEEEVDAKLSPDGRSIIFIRGRNLRESSGVWISRFQGGAWSRAELVGPPVSVAGTAQFGAVLTRDGKRMYFASNRPGGLGGFDHYYTDRTGSGWSEPVNLTAINTAGNDADIAPSRDGRTLVFPARREPSFGETDLYRTRWENGALTAPENLGPRINTPGHDTCPWLGYDGHTLYLNSTWNGLTGGVKGESRIWMIRYSGGF